jgi:profilin
LTSRLIKAADGVCIVKTTQAFLVCTYKEGIQPGNCAKVVEALADYLISVGFVSFYIIETMCY